MRFPDKLTVRVQDRDTGRPAPDIAIVLVLFAAHKNDYYVGPLITDSSGKVVFTRAGCEDTIKRSQQMFLMDYSGDLESCRPVVEASLHPPEHIETMLQQYKQSPDFWGKGFPNPTRLFTDLQKVRNRDYEQAATQLTEEQVLANPQIEFSLVRKAA